MPLHLPTNLFTSAWMAVALLLIGGALTDASAQITFSTRPIDADVACSFVPNPPAVTAAGGCGGAVTVAYAQTRQDGSCAQDYTLTRTWTVTDPCGTKAVHTQRITVTDTQAPIIAGVPANANVPLGAEPGNPNVKAIDFCDAAATLSLVRDSIPGACGGYAIIRNYTASDACGNVRTARYIVNVNKDSPPVISGVTPGKTLTCGAALPAPPNVTATDAEGTVILSVRLDTLRDRGGDTCKIVRRIWSATDNCGLVTTAEQRFTFKDGIAPTITGVPANAVIYCETLPAPPIIGVDIVANDNCDPSAVIVYKEISEKTNNGTCSDQIYRVIRTWTARDECGNATTRTQILEMKCECCSNGIDDDDDGLVDDYDPQCNCFSGVEAACDSLKRYYIPPVLAPIGEVYNEPSEVVITTLAPVANIQVQTADGTTYNQTFTVSKGSPLKIPLNNTQLQTLGHDKVERNKGWIITSDQLIQPIYRIDSKYNKVLVTIKGPQALGRVFRAGSQTNTCGKNKMGGGEGHFISVMAAEDDTEITIDFKFPALGGLKGPITRKLNRNETYLIRDDENNSTVSGSLITSTKPIAVVTGSQHTYACKYPKIDNNPTGGQDGGIDQLVPNCLTGDEYVMVRGKGNQVQQYAVLVANKNNTRVILNGDVNSEIVLQAGDYTQVWLDGGAYDSKHFKGNKPFYAYQVAGISTNNEVGMAICGPVGECKGDTLIEFPKFEFTPDGRKPENVAYVIIPTAGLGTLQINDQPYTTCATAKPVPGRPDLSTVTFDNNCLKDVNKISSKTRFIAGLLVGISGDSGTHGYLTSFKDRMEVRHPRNNEITTAYFVDTLCGSTSNKHCLKVASCAVDHNIVAVRANFGTVTIDGGTCLTYTSPDSLQGMDQVLVTVQNDQGLFQTVCLSYFVCSAPPQVKFPFVDTTVSCDRVPPVTPPQMSDECGQKVDFLTEDIRDDGSCDYSYLITRKWVFWDECGDSTHASQIIRVIDTSGPIVINLPSDTTISACSVVPPVPTLTWQENCDADYNWSFRQETVDSTCAVNFTVVRTWEAWDECGNRTTAVQRIELRDTAAPILAGVPPDVLLTCGQTAPMPTVTASDDCDPNPAITFESIVLPPTCDTAYHELRRWTVRDLCGQTATATQRVLLIDKTPPQVINIPKDTAIACGQPLPTAAPQFVDDCAVPPVVYVVDSVATGTCPIIEQVYRTWSITDACGNELTARQVISITDSLGPVFVPLPDTIFASCSDSIVILEPTVIQACGAALTFVDSMASGPGCNGERLLYRTYTATDNCGRASTYKQLYYFKDAVPPVWVQEPSDVVLSCSDPIPPVIDPNVADACSGFNPVAVIIRDSSQVCPATRWIVRNYTVSDWCGNLSYFTHRITIIGCEPVAPVLATGQAGCIGEDITLAVTLDSGYVTPVYQWQFSPDGINFTNVGGVVSDPSFIIPNADPSRDGVYRVNVANNATELGSGDCSSLSNPIPLTIRPPMTSSETIEICRGDTLFYLGDTLTQNVTRTDSLQTWYGCDSVATMTLNVYPFVDVNVDTVICFGESLTFFGQTYTASGSFIDTLVTAYGCDSTLSLKLLVLPDLRRTVDAQLCTGETYAFSDTTYALPGTYLRPYTSVNGCDSAQTLVLRQVPTASTRIDTVVCEGETVLAAGEAFTAAGTYVRTLLTSQGCDSVITLALRISKPDTGRISSHVCFGEKYFFGTQRLDQAGVYYRTLPNKYGCDSTVELTLRASPRFDVDVRAELCQGEIYRNGPYSFAAAGRWPMQFYTADGCDSTVNVTLVYRRPTTAALDITICAGESYPVADTTYGTPGRFVRKTRNRYGCDSTITLELTVVQPQRTLVRETLCFGESLQAAGRTFKQTTKDSFLLRGKAGCDSLVVVDLRVRPNTSQDTVAAICFGESLTVAGRTYDATGKYIVPGKDRNGCDSTWTLYLSVYPEQRDTLRRMICEGDSVTVGMITFRTAGTFTLNYEAANFCDSIIVLDLTVLPNSDTTLDTYVCAGESLTVLDTVLRTAGQHIVHGTSANGCDSVVTVNLDVVAPVRAFVRDTLCAGQLYAVGGRIIAVTTFDSIRLSSALGCDSTIVFDIFIRTADTARTAAEVCFGESYTLAGVTYDSSGRYVTRGTNVFGCDSTHVLTLVVLPQNLVRREEAICVGDTLRVDRYAVYTSGVHELRFTDVNGCDSTIVVNLTVHDTARTFLNQEICTGETVTFGNRTLLRPGRYEQVLQTRYGCDSTVVLDLTVKPTYSITLDTTVCAGTTVTFGTRKLERPGRYVDSLQTKAGCDSVIVLTLRNFPATSARDTVHVCEGDGLEVGGVWRTQTGAYATTHANQYGCDSTHTLQLIVHANVTRHDTLRICHDGSVVFDGQTLTSSGTYVAELRTRFGCDSTVILELIVTDEVRLAADDAEICAGSSVALQARGYNGPVRWSPAAGLSCVTCPNPIASPTETTTYTVSANDCSGRTVTAEAKVRVRQPVGVKIVSKRKLRLGESTTLKAVADDPNARLSWRQGNTVLCDACDEIEVRPLVTTVYEVQATNGNGCDDTERLTLIVEDECSFADIEIPNIITPNNDGANDLFEIRYSGLKDIILLRIYNRWGELVYETKDIDRFWDGTHRGVPLNPGVFVYYMEGHCLNDEPFTEEGNVTLVR